jgi:O-antigen biosynthesis protein
MWASGLPVLAFDLGAVGERIRQHGGGWLVAEATAEAALATLLHLATDRDGFASRLADVAAWQAGAGGRESCAAMAESYHELYARLMEHRRDRQGVPDRAAEISPA